MSLQALRYKELEFDETLPSRDLVESLVSINYLLGHTQAAKGILEFHTSASAEEAMHVIARAALTASLDLPVESRTLAACRSDRLAGRCMPL